MVKTIGSCDSSGEKDLVVKCDPDDIEQGDNLVKTDNLVKIKPNLLTGNYREEDTIVVKIERHHWFSW